MSRLGGRMFSDQTIDEMMQSAAGTYIDAVSIYADGSLLLPPRTPNHCGNHGCEPNLCWVDPFSLVTRLPIPAGAELTVDYGTLTDDADFQMDCECGATCCRGVVTGADWMRVDLQERYGDHWVPVLFDWLRLSAS